MKHPFAVSRGGCGVHQGGKILALSCANKRGFACAGGIFNLFTILLISSHF